VSESVRREKKHRDHIDALKQTRETIAYAAEFVEESEPNSDAVRQMKDVFEGFVALETEVSARAEALKRLSNELVRENAHRSYILPSSI
jgi:predicted  nucleic acid-binding Zn-ribbon protein